jgi:predicted metalloprotease
VTLHSEPPPDEGAQAIEGDLDLSYLVPFTVQGLDEYWKTTLGQLGGGTYSSFTTKPFRGSGQQPECSGLAADQIVGHVLYCPAGDFVTWDEDTIDALYDRGDFAVSATIADAWAAGILKRLNVQGDARSLGLDADCLAGAWGGGFARQEFQVIDETTGDPVLLSAGDLDEAIAGFLFASGTVGAKASFDTDQTAAFDRVSAFQRGFETGAKSCVN